MCFVIENDKKKRLPSFMNLPSLLSALLLSFSVIIATGCSKEKVPVGSTDVAKLRQDLKSPDPQTRQTACTDLALLGHDAKPALSDLIPLLSDQDSLTRRLAAYAVGQIGPDAKSAIPELKKLFIDPDPAVMTTAINAVNTIDPKESEGARLQNVTQ
jgi:HEAT repeat protein